MNRGYEKSIGIKIVVNRNPMPLIFKRMAVVTVFRAPPPGYFKFTFKIVYPTAYDGSGTLRQIII
jgi:hypothetical protein